MFSFGCASIESEKDTGKSDVKNARPVVNPNAEVDVTFGSRGQLLVTLSESDQLALIDMETFTIGILSMSEIILRMLSFRTMDKNIML